MFHPFRSTAARADRSRPRLAALAALLLLPGTLAAQTAPAAPSLSLEQALRMARENNPAFQQQRNDVDVARAEVRSAYGDLLPSANFQSGFGYTASGVRRFGSVELGRQPDYYSSDYVLGLSYDVNGQTLLRPAVQKAQKRATERRVVGAAANLEAEVSQQYLTVLQAREQVSQAQREVARTEEHLKLAKARLEVGAGTPLDVRRAEVQKGQAEVALVRAAGEADIAALRLGQVVGVPLDPAVQLTSRFEVFEPKWQATELVEVALANNPLLLAARAGSQAARTSVAAARTQYLPTVSMNMGWRGSIYQAGDIDPLVNSDIESFGQRFENCVTGNEVGKLIGRAPRDCAQFDVNDPAVVQGLRANREAQNSGFPFDYTRQPLSASLVVSLPIFQGFSRQLQVDQAKAQAADARHQVRAEELRLRQEVSAAVRNLETSYQAALLQANVRLAASEELRLAQERFRFGAANSIEVTDAQTRLTQAERDEIVAVYDFHRTLAALEALVGRELR